MTILLTGSSWEDNYLLNHVCIVIVSTLPELLSILQFVFLYNYSLTQPHSELV